MTAPLRFHLQTGRTRPDLGLLWRDLETRADPTFFLSWDWIGTWLAELDPLPPVLVGEAGGFAFPFFERFQRRLVETGVPGGTAELLRVSRGDEPIGYLLNLVYRGHVLGFVNRFHFEDDARLKPGLVCHALAIARHAAEGAAVYDFLAGAARYRANLGQRGPEFVYLLIQRPTVMTRAERQLRRAWTGLRPALRRVGIRR